MRNARGEGDRRRAGTEIDEGKRIAHIVRLVAQRFLVAEDELPNQVVPPAFDASIGEQRAAESVAVDHFDDPHPRAELEGRQFLPHFARLVAEVLAIPAANSAAPCRSPAFGFLVRHHRASDAIARAHELPVPAPRGAEWPAVAFLAKIGLHEAIPAEGRHAERRASVRRVVVPVVACLAERDDAVAAAMGVRLVDLPVAILVAAFGVALLDHRERLSGAYAGRLSVFVAGLKAARADADARGTCRAGVAGDGREGDAGHGLVVARGDGDGEFGTAAAREEAREQCENDWPRNEGGTGRRERRGRVSVPTMPSAG